jgi:hypothetical protein
VWDPWTRTAVSAGEPPASGISWYVAHRKLCILIHYKFKEIKTIHKFEFNEREIDQILAHVSDP